MWRESVTPSPPPLLPSPCSLQCVCAEHVIKKKFVCALRCIFFSSFFFWYFSAVACQIKCQVYVTVKRLKNVDKEAAKKRFENCVLMSTRALFSFFFFSKQIRETGPLFHRHTVEMEIIIYRK